MNKELQDKLMEKYPKIFYKGIDSNKTVTCMYLGIECHNGWYDLLDALCFNIQEHCNNENLRYIVETDKYKFVVEGDPDYVQVIVAQIKEKMGTLRFYVDGGDKTTEGMIRMAESMSSRLCELCGNSATTNRDSGWLHTTCAACNLKRHAWAGGRAEEFLNDINTDSAAFQSHCHSCGVPWASHMGIAGTCAENAQLRKGLEEAKQGKFSKNPPKIKQKTKKDKPIKKSIKKETTYKILGSPKTMSAFKQMLGYPTKKKKTK